MRRLTPLLVVVLLAVTATGCYHARVETGLTPGSQVIDKPWAMGFIYGLVPPETVDASSQCSGGVAIVETQLSFLNQVVSALTFGIVTPMHITVTCASGSASAGTTETEVAVARDAEPEAILEAMELASSLAVTQAEPVRVRFY
ncbi:MAG: hypothetical protein AAF089_17125 [Bacteroidota bacterium]